MEELIHLLVSKYGLSPAAARSYAQMMSAPSTVVPDAVSGPTRDKKAQMQSKLAQERANPKNVRPDAISGTQGRLSALAQMEGPTERQTLPSGRMSPVAGYGPSTPMHDNSIAGGQLAMPTPGALGSVITPTLDANQADAVRRGMPTSGIR